MPAIARPSVCHTGGSVKTITQVVIAYIHPKFGTGTKNEMPETELP